MEEVKIGGYVGSLQFLKYSNTGRNAIRYVNNTGVIATLTVNLTYDECGDDEAYINSNLTTLPAEEIIEELRRVGVVTDIVGKAFSGYCEYPRVKISSKCISSA